MKTRHNIVNGFDFSDLPIEVTYIGLNKSKEWPHYLWNVLIKHNDGFFTFQYKTGTGLVDSRNKPKRPINPDIMHSLLIDSEASEYNFEEWCDNFGMDSDSIKALNMYKDCLDTARRLKKAFGKDQVEAMRAALQDY